MNYQRMDDPITVLIEPSSVHSTHTHFYQTNYYRGPFGIRDVSLFLRSVTRRSLRLMFQTIDCTCSRHHSIFVIRKSINSYQFYKSPEPRNVYYYFIITSKVLLTVKRETRRPIKTAVGAALHRRLWVAGLPHLWEWIELNVNGPATIVPLAQSELCSPQLRWPVSRWCYYVWPHALRTFLSYYPSNFRLPTVLSNDLVNV